LPDKFDLLTLHKLWHI